MEQISRLTAGIDTSKDKLDLAVHGSPLRLTVTNDKRGWRRLATECRKAGVNHIGIEPTAGYERGVTDYLRVLNYVVLVLQPHRVRMFARALGIRAKNDRIDAAVIAACAHALDAPSVPADPRFNQLADNLTFIEQIEEDIVRAITRAHHARLPGIRQYYARELKRLRAERQRRLGDLACDLRAEPDLGSRLALVLSIPGIGDRTAIAIIVRMPELGQISREQAAALAGLAPFDDDSGKHRGARHIAGGRGRLRRSLYAAALPAAFRWNPALKALYERLTARGKCHKSALVACARKLLIYANTVVARGTKWDAQPVAA